MKHPVNLKRLFGTRFRITWDGWALYRGPFPVNPWYCVIPCRYGELAPYSDDKLAVLCDHGPTIERLKVLPGLRLEETAPEEALFTFHVDDFDTVEPIVEPRPRTRLESVHRHGFMHWERSRSARRLYWEHKNKKAGKPTVTIKTK